MELDPICIYMNTVLLIEATKLLYFDFCLCVCGRCRPRTYCLADSDEESSSAGSSDEEDPPELLSDKTVLPGGEGWENSPHCHELEQKRRKLKTARTPYRQIWHWHWSGLAKFAFITPSISIHPPMYSSTFKLVADFMYFLVTALHPGDAVMNK